MRPIDADKIPYHEIDEIGGEYAPYLGCSKETIDNMPTVEIRLKQKWIPTDKAKPWFNYDVLVCCADGQIRIGYYEQEGNIWYAGNRPSDVIAWMQLPDVYEGENDDRN